MSMSSAGRAENSNGCVTRPKGREIGLSGFAAQIQLYSLTGSYVMATAEQREPYESRGSSTVLGSRGGEIPPRDSTKCEELDVSISGPLLPSTTDIRADLPVGRVVQLRTMVAPITSSQVRRGRQKQLVGAVTDGAVAFAGQPFDAGAIEDVNVTAPVANHAGGLEQPRGDRHRRSPHAQHLAEKLLGQGNDVTVDGIMRLQQPARQACLQGMQGIARDRLLDLADQQIVVTHDEGTNGGALVGDGMKGGRRNAR